MISSVEDMSWLLIYFIVSLEKNESWQKSLQIPAKSWKIILNPALQGVDTAILGKYYVLLYKHQWNTKWAFPRKLYIFTREDSMFYLQHLSGPES